jgi:hypothetical protein
VLEQQTAAVEQETVTVEQETVTVEQEIDTGVQLLPRGAKASKEAVAAIREQLDTMDTDELWGMAKSREVQAVPAEGIKGRLSGARLPMNDKDPVKMRASGCWVGSVTRRTARTLRKKRVRSTAKVLLYSPVNGESGTH